MPQHPPVLSNIPRKGLTIMIESDFFADATAFRHKFFTREGGVSNGLYASLNCGTGSSDREENVFENRRRASESLGVPPNRLITLRQVHSANVIVVSDPSEVITNRPKADAMVTGLPNIALGILTADCAPVLLAEPESSIIGAAHAGWKGALSGVIENTISEMQKLGARRENIIACVGPCIAQESYEVGPEFRAHFVVSDPSSSSYFIPDPKTGKNQFDLRGYILSRLSTSGATIRGGIKLDTYAHEDLFFSYRRACHRGEADYGRGLSAIVLGS